MAACAGCAVDSSLAEVPVVGVTGVTLDSRAVRPGDLYAALPGARVHGATFAADVRDRGAAAVLTDHEGAALMARAGVALPAVVVAQPRAVLGAVAALVYGSPGERPDDGRDHRHQRQDDDGLPARVRAPRRSAA